MIQLIIRNANLPDGRSGIDIACDNGVIIDSGPSIEANAAIEIDAGGNLVTPPFVDSHLHLDSTLSLGNPRFNESGTLLEGIKIWGELKPELSVENIKTRARRLCEWAIAQGNLALRSHVDICDPGLLAVEALLEIREEFRAYIDIQLVAFPQDGYLRCETAADNLRRALEKGVDVVGGIPHFERTMAQGTESVGMLCEIAAHRGLLVDMHCDESDDPMSRHIETLCFETQRLGLNNRVTGSHLTSMHSMDNYYASKLISLMVESGVNAIANPLINITLQGRFDSYPKRRGMTRVKELMARGVNVSFGHDCIMDPWYALGTHDMLEVAHMAIHIGQLTAMAEIQSCFQAITSNAAGTMCIEKYGLEPGCHADMVILAATSVFDCIRRRPVRSHVIRRGEIIAKAEPTISRISLADRDVMVDFSAI